ncbi:MAG: GMC family oxidoreductase [Cytophagales bacterium]|nr:GMC family oxidoreductase [Cytophagales bacterium]
MHLNIRAKKQHTYDAIVIGTGISGGWAMKELTEKGLRVLALERGRMVEHVKDYPTALKAPWEMPHRGRLAHAYKAENPFVVRSGVVNEYNQHFFVPDSQHPYVEEKPFTWVRGYQVGGKSLLWGRWTQRWGVGDFEANAREGIAVDWPIRYPDLAPWYSYVEKFAGISGNKDGLAQVPDGEFLPPMEMNCFEQYMKGQIESKLKGRHLIISRHANLSRAEPQHTAVGRGPCQYRNLCGRGCPYGAYFSTNSATLPAAQQTGRLTLLPDSVVHSILYDEQKGRATGVRVTEATTRAVTEYYARIIFVNASTVNTNLLLLNSTSARFPAGLGNDSGTLGKYVMDHNYRVSGVGYYDGLPDKYYYGRRPVGLYVPRFRNFGTDMQTAFQRGYALAGGTARLGFERGMQTAGLGAGFKDGLSGPGPWMMAFTAMGEMLPYEDNRISLDPDRKDAWDMPLVRFHVSWHGNEDAMSRDAVEQVGETLAAGGLRDIHVSDKHVHPGQGIHEMGGCRMGRDPKTSMLNAWNQLHAVKNVFVTDGACMTSSACQNPSLTYMALTARAADHAVTELKKRNL